MVKGLPASPLLQTHGRRPDKRAAHGANHGTPSDIADVVAFVASPDARWVTGLVLDKQIEAVNE